VTLHKFEICRPLAASIAQLRQRTFKSFYTNGLRVLKAQTNISSQTQKRFKNWFDNIAASEADSVVWIQLPIP
jgi:RNA binding exosome subunit